MRRHFMFATVLAAAMSVGASAQSGTGQAGTAGQGGTMGQSEPSRSAEKQAKNKNETVTLTGCIQSGTQTSSSTAGTSGTSASSSSSGTMGTAGNASGAAGAQFVLANITGAPASLSGANSVALSGKEKDLQKHVGHKVEITGKLEATSPRASSSYGGAPGAAGTSGSAETLKVSSIKMLAESCSAQ